MTLFSSIIQGFLFATMNAAALAYISQEFLGAHRPIPLAARLLVYHFLLTFLLGMTVSEATAVRADEVRQGLVVNLRVSAGPLGALIFALLSLYATFLLVVVTNEVGLVLVPVFFVIHVFAVANARAGTAGAAAAIIAMAATFLALSAVMSKSPVVDPIADSLSSPFDLPPSSAPPNYLGRPGSIFSIPALTELLVGAFAGATVLASSGITPLRLMVNNYYN